MAESKLRTLSVDFAVQILNLVKFLKSQHETIVSNQIGRAGTSIGANIHEAQYAHGKPDFIAKLQIALKEASETSYWLELLLKTNYIDEAKYQELNNFCSQIRVMLIKSIIYLFFRFQGSKSSSGTFCIRRFNVSIEVASKKFPFSST